MYLFKTAFKYLCLPNIQVTVHKISEVLNVMTENRTNVIIFPDTLVLKPQPGAEPEKVPCAAEMRELSAGSRSPHSGGSSPPGVLRRSLAAARAVVRARHRLCPGSLLRAASVHLQLSSSDYRPLHCNLLIASHF